MEVNTFLWIGGIAVVAILGIYTIKASKKGPEKTKVSPINPTGSRTAEGENQNRIPVLPPNPDSQEKPAPPEPPKPINLLAAKVAFLNNITRFVPKLNTLCDGTYNSSDWTEDIIDINDENLMAFWKKIHMDNKAILRVLSGWGLKPEMCSSFMCLAAHKELYTKADGTLIEVGKNYNVIKQCWILTEVDADGKTAKRVLVKGEVE